jgi:hypothetical protein
MIGPETILPPSLVTKEEMIGLVRAIKFANPDASIRQVHKEITEVLSQKDSYDFLANISLNDVKKVWKKALMMTIQQQQQQQQQQQLQQQSFHTQIPETIGTNEEPTLHLYTVGNASIPFLAQEYSQSKAREAAAAASNASLQNSSHMVPVFLNIPADRSGHRPYQAVVNFCENYATISKHEAPSSTTTTTTSTSTNHNMTSKQKGHDGNRNNHKHKSKPTKGSQKQDDDSPIICKIQVAAASPSKETKFPMLLYNQDRTIRTFIHPEDDNKQNDDNGYNRIHSLVTCHGVGGALGNSGGSKAYFYTYLVAKDILNIDTSRLADVPSTW